MNLSTRYEWTQVEDRVYRRWEEADCFRSTPDDARTPYAIVIPPPNITGALHMGHALNSTLQDILTRFRRMQGLNALWLPGTDHAGIATQHVVEEQLASEGLSRKQIGREKFIERVWSWKEQYGNRIVEQLKKLGSSCDWQRLRFTMDEGLSRAVRFAFVRLYEQKLIYRGQYIVNWCPRDQTALADVEVEHQEVQGNLWYFMYPLKGMTKRFVVVATTRPETMLGDTAVAVHPEDERYQDLIGKTVILPLMGREIPIIADEQVDPQFGTGAVKVTPAHDPNDFEIGNRHELERISVMDGRGVMNENAGRFAGQDRFDAREAVVQALDELNLVQKIEEHTHKVGHCYRCQTIIEPMASDQWFVKMKPLANAAIEASNAGRVRFHPPRYEKIYLHWLENVRDWCISRQLWWGHRIPVWTCEECEHVNAAIEDPDRCPACGSTKIVQDPDVLDTWFSSALWPFSTLGWPDETKDLTYYYPTDTLVTGRDIIYFWVARMIMMGLRMVHNVPFRDVYINGTILDETGRPMSKSLGNGIDPLEMIEQYGADAVRFSLIMLSTEGQDLKLALTRFEEGRNFANKIWNVARFCLLRLSETPPPAADEPPVELDALNFEDRWILSRLTRAVTRATDALEAFRFNEAFRVIYSFVWDEFCAWYVELVKPRLGTDADADADSSARRVAQRVLAYVLDHSLRLLHPLMPYLTEEIWSHLLRVAPQRRLFAQDGDGARDYIMMSRWPTARGELLNDEVESEMECVQAVVVAVRRIREKRNVPHRDRPEVIVATPDEQTGVLIKRHRDLIAMMARSQPPTTGVGLSKPERAAAEVLDGGIQVFVPVTGNVEAERERVNKELERTRQQLTKIESQLQTQDFIDKARPEVVTRQRDRREQFLTKVAKLEKHLEDL